VGSIPANPDAQNVPSFRRWRFEMKLSPFLIAGRRICIHLAEQLPLYPGFLALVVGRFGPNLIEGSDNQEGWVLPSGQCLEWALLKNQRQGERVGLQCWHLDLEVPITDLQHDQLFELDACVYGA
jgi:hypothetical protein